MLLWPYDIIFELILAGADFAYLLCIKGPLSIYYICVQF